MGTAGEERTEYDVVVVGAGSAGCAVAARLSEDPSLQVLLLEAGGSDKLLEVQVPAGLYKVWRTRRDWNYTTDPQPGLDGRSLFWPRGKLLGGSSSINAMIYMRGAAADYDEWAELTGDKAWSYEQVLPLFRRMEDNSRGADHYHGAGGPLRVEDLRSPHVWTRAVIQSAVAAGYPRNDDFNGAVQEGVGQYQVTQKRGRRWSSADAYLHPAEGRPNLHVVTRALTTRVLLERGRVVGVEYVEVGIPKSVRAAREVILAGGAINSPQLLMLSGVGPADHLREVGVPVAHDLPGVGQDLQDHLELYVQYESLQPVTLLTAMRPHNMVRIGVRWFLSHDGLAASSHLEAGGFIRSAAGVRHPDIQYHFLPALVSDHGRAKGDLHAFQAHVGPMRPASRGWLRLRSADPKVHPVIEPNYLSEERDRAELRACVRLTREIFAQEAFAPYRGRELMPGPEATSDEAIDTFVRRKADSAYHPCCTCRMGTDELAVVDPACRVRGLDGLRVVDASVMPSMVSGNLNAPTIMIGEKASDAILGRPPLPPSNAPVYEAPDWRTRQR